MLASTAALTPSPLVGEGRGGGYRIGRNCCGAYAGYFLVCSAMRAKAASVSSLT
jgi:hypothetical protein